MRHLSALIAALGTIASGACGGGAPSTPSPAVQFSLAAGTYTLSFAPAMAPGGLLSICFSTGFAPNTSAIPVIVEISGSNWEIRAAEGADLGLRATLRATGGTTIGGPVSGAREPLTGVIVTVLPPQNGATASLTGDSANYRTPNRIGGVVDGEVTISADAGTGSCRPTGWALEPR